MLQKFRDALACLLLGLLIVSVLEARSWIQRQPDLIMETLGNLDDMTRTASVTASTASPIILKTLIHADKAVGETANAAQHVSTMTRDISKQQLAVAASTMLVVAKTDQVMGKTGEMVDSLKEQIEQVGEQGRYTLSEVELASKSARYTIDDLDRNFVNNQDIKDSFKNVALITANWNDLSSDAVKVERRYFFPEPYRGKHPLLHGIGHGIYGTLRIVGPFAEAGYYTSNFNLKR